MPRLYVTGGRQKSTLLRRKDEWHAYEKAVLLELNTDTGAVRTVLEHEAAPAHRPATGASHLFKAGSWDGEHLLLCTQTEVLKFDVDREQVVDVVSHPWMNDVHHVVRHNGRLHVVSTGLDCVLVFEPDDATVAEVHSVTGASTWERFDQGTDYRRVATTKPHRCHPNYLTVDQDSLWVTRFEQRDAVALPGSAVDAGTTTPAIATDPIHDGIRWGDHLWYTVVSGSVVTLDRRTRAITGRYSLDRIGDEGGVPLGWCRGIHREGDDTLLAFSRLRPTKIKQNLAWLRAPLGKAPEAKPARVVSYQLEAGRKGRTWVLEDAGISSIFSLVRHPRD